jgi:hypothetical protein
MKKFETFDRVLVAPPPRKETIAISKTKKDPKYMRGYHIDEVATSRRIQNT